MYKSAVVKLVLLNSVLAFSACTRTCEPEQVKKDGQPLAEKEQEPRRRSCHGSARGAGRTFIYVHGAGGGVAARTGGGRPGHTGSSSVGRGGFGATGSGAGT
jgi:hypothetical protein